MVLKFFKNLGATSYLQATWTKYHSGDPQTLDVSVQKLVATRPGARDLFTRALHIW